MTSSQSTSCAAKAQPEKVVRSGKKQDFSWWKPTRCSSYPCSLMHREAEINQLYMNFPLRQGGNVTVTKDASYPANGAAFLASQH